MSIESSTSNIDSRISHIESREMGVKRDDSLVEKTFYVGSVYESTKNTLFEFDKKIQAKESDYSLVKHYSQLIQNLEDCSFESEHISQEEGEMIKNITSHYKTYNTCDNFFNTSQNPKKLVLLFFKLIQFGVFESENNDLELSILVAIFNSLKNEIEKELTLVYYFVRDNREVLPEIHSSSDLYSVLQSIPDLKEGILIRFLSFNFELIEECSTIMNKHINSAFSRKMKGLRKLGEGGVGPVFEAELTSNNENDIFVNQNVSRAEKLLGIDLGEYATKIMRTGNFRTEKEFEDIDAPPNAFLFPRPYFAGELLRASPPISVGEFFGDDSFGKIIQKAVDKRNTSRSHIYAFLLKHKTEMKNKKLTAEEYTNQLVQSFQKKIEKRIKDGTNLLGSFISILLDKANEVEAKDETTSRGKETMYFDVGSQIWQEVDVIKIIHTIDQAIHTPVLASYVPKEWSLVLKILKKALGVQHLSEADRTTEHGITISKDISYSHKKKPGVFINNILDIASNEELLHFFKQEEKSDINELNSSIEEWTGYVTGMESTIEAISMLDHLRHIDDSLSQMSPRSKDLYPFQSGISYEEIKTSIMLNADHPCFQTFNTEYSAEEFSSFMQVVVDTMLHDEEEEYQRKYKETQDEEDEIKRRKHILNEMGRFQEYSDQHIDLLFNEKNKFRKEMESILIKNLHTKKNKVFDICEKLFSKENLSEGFVAKLLPVLNKVDVSQLKKYEKLNLDPDFLKTISDETSEFYFIYKHIAQIASVVCGETFDISMMKFPENVISSLIQLVEAAQVATCNDDLFKKLFHSSFRKGLNSLIVHHYAKEIFSGDIFEDREKIKKAYVNNITGKKSEGCLKTFGELKSICEGDASEENIEKFKEFILERLEMVSQEVWPDEADRPAFLDYEEFSCYKKLKDIKRHPFYILFTQVDPKLAKVSPTRTYENMDFYLEEFESYIRKNFNWKDFHKHIESWVIEELHKEEAKLSEQSKTLSELKGSRDRKREVFLEKVQRGSYEGNEDPDKMKIEDLLNDSNPINIYYLFGVSYFENLIEKTSALSYLRSNILRDFIKDHSSIENGKIVMKPLSSQEYVAFIMKTIEETFTDSDHRLQALKEIFAHFYRLSLIREQPIDKLKIDQVRNECHTAAYIKDRIGQDTRSQKVPVHALQLFHTPGDDETIILDANVPGAVHDKIEVQAIIKKILQRPDYVYPYVALDGENMPLAASKMNIRCLSDVTDNKEACIGDLPVLMNLVLEQLTGYVSAAEAWDFATYDCGKIDNIGEVLMFDRSYLELLCGYAHEFVTPLADIDAPYYGGDVDAHAQYIDQVTKLTFALQELIQQTPLRDVSKIVRYGAVLYTKLCEMEEIIEAYVTATSSSRGDFYPQRYKMDDPLLTEVSSDAAKKVKKLGNEVFVRPSMHLSPQNDVFFVQVAMETGGTLNIYQTLPKTLCVSPFYGDLVNILNSVGYKGDEKLGVSKFIHNGGYASLIHLLVVGGGVRVLEGGKNIDYSRPTEEIVPQIAINSSGNCSYSMTLNCKMHVLESFLAKENIICCDSISVVVERGKKEQFLLRSYNKREDLDRGGKSYPNIQDLCRLFKNLSVDKIDTVCNQVFSGYRRDKHLDEIIMRFEKAKEMDKNSELSTQLWNPVWIELIEDILILLNPKYEDSIRRMSAKIESIGCVVQRDIRKEVFQQFGNVEEVRPHLLRLGVPMVPLKSQIQGVENLLEHIQDKHDHFTKSIKKLLYEFQESIEEFDFNMLHPHMQKKETQKNPMDYYSTILELIENESDLDPNIKKELSKHVSLLGIETEDEHSWVFDPTMLEYYLTHLFDEEYKEFSSCKNGQLNTLMQKFSRAGYSEEEVNSLASNLKLMAKASRLRDALVEEENHPLSEMLSIRKVSGGLSKKTNAMITILRLCAIDTGINGINRHEHAAMGIPLQELGIVGFVNESNFSELRAELERFQFPEDFILKVKKAIEVYLSCKVTLPNMITKKIEKPTYQTPKRVGFTTDEVQMVYECSHDVSRELQSFYHADNIEHYCIQLCQKRFQENVDDSAKEARKYISFLRELPYEKKNEIYTHLLKIEKGIRASNQDLRCSRFSRAFEEYIAYKMLPILQEAIVELQNEQRDDSLNVLERDTISEGDLQKMVYNMFLFDTDERLNVSKKIHELSENEVQFSVDAIRCLYNGESMNIPIMDKALTDCSEYADDFERLSRIVQLVFGSKNLEASPVSSGGILSEYTQYIQQMFPTVEDKVEEDVTEVINLYEEWKELSVFFLDFLGRDGYEDAEMIDAFKKLVSLSPNKKCVPLLQLSALKNEYKANPYLYQDLSNNKKILLGRIKAIIRPTLEAQEKYLLEFESITKEPIDLNALIQNVFVFNHEEIPEYFEKMQLLPDKEKKEFILQIIEYKRAAPSFFIGQIKDAMPRGLSRAEQYKFLMRAMLGDGSIEGFSWDKYIDYRLSVLKNAKDASFYDVWKDLYALKYSLKPLQDYTFQDSIAAQVENIETFLSEEDGPLELDDKEFEATLKKYSPEYKKYLIENLKAKKTHLEILQFALQHCKEIPNAFAPLNKRQRKLVTILQSLPITENLQEDILKHNRLAVQKVGQGINGNQKQVSANLEDKKQNTKDVLVDNVISNHLIDSIVSEIYFEEMKKVTSENHDIQFEFIRQQATSLDSVIEALYIYGDESEKNRLLELIQMLPPIYLNAKKSKISEQSKIRRALIDTMKEVGQAEPQRVLDDVKSIANKISMPKSLSSDTPLPTIDDFGEDDDFFTDEGTEKLEPPPMDGIEVESDTLLRSVDSGTESEEKGTDYSESVCEAIPTTDIPGDLDTSKFPTTHDDDVVLVADNATTQEIRLYESENVVTLLKNIEVENAPIQSLQERLKYLLCFNDEEYKGISFVDYRMSQVDIQDMQEVLSVYFMFLPELRESFLNLYPIFQSTDAKTMYDSFKSCVPSLSKELYYEMESIYIALCGDFVVGNDVIDCLKSQNELLQDETLGIMIDHLPKLKQYSQQSIPVQIRDLIACYLMNLKYRKEIEGNLDNIKKADDFRKIVEVVYGPKSPEVIHRYESIFDKDTLISFVLELKDQETVEAVAEMLNSTLEAYETDKVSVVFQNVEDVISSISSSSEKDYLFILSKFAQFAILRQVAHEEDDNQGVVLQEMTDDLGKVEVRRYPIKEKLKEYAKQITIYDLVQLLQEDRWKEITPHARKAVFEACKESLRRKIFDFLFQQYKGDEEKREALANQFCDIIQEKMEEGHESALQILTSLDGIEQYKKYHQNIVEQRMLLLTETYLK